MAKEIVRVLRVIEYVGERKFVEDTVSRSIHGVKYPVSSNPINYIKAATIGEFPEILEKEDLDLAYLESQEFYNLMAQFRDAVSSKGLEETGEAMEAIKTFIRNKGKDNG